MSDDPGRPESPILFPGDRRKFSIASLLPQLPPITIVDVGAMTLGEDSDPYARLLRSLRCEVIGFEPLPEECEKLNSSAPPGRFYYPYFIGDGSEQTFHVTSTGMASSLFEPNHALLAMFQYLEEDFEVIETRRVRTVRLDDIPEARGADLLKVDVQGAELMVFCGAAEMLRNVLVVHTEAEFVPMYRNQPLFADVDSFLRAQGFVLHNLASIAGRTFKPLFFADNPVGAMSQHLWCDAVYVRDFTALDRLTAEQLLKLAAILHENYASVDLAAVVLKAYDRKAGGDLAVQYLNRIVDPLPDRPQ